MNRELLWPTPVYFKTISNSITLNKKLTKDIISWSKKAPTEIKTNSGEGWHSPTIMHTKPEYNTLQKEIMTMAQEVFQELIILRFLKSPELSIQSILDLDLIFYCPDVCLICLDHYGEL